MGFFQAPFRILTFFSPAAHSPWKCFTFQTASVLIKNPKEPLQKSELLMMFFYTFLQWTMVLSILMALVHKERQECAEMGGGGRVATITGWAVSPRWKKKILFSVAKLLLSFVENIWGPCKPMLRWEKIRVDEQFSPRKKYYHQLKRNKCIFLCFSNPFHNWKLIILPFSFLHPVLDLFLGSVKQVAFLCIIQLCWVKCAL